MALFDRLNDLARNITDKTTDAIETGKFASKANNEKNLAGGELKKIGEYTEKYNAIVRRVVTEPIEISSTLVRKTIREGGDISKMVDPKVRMYIEDHCLFR